MDRNPHVYYPEVDMTPADVAEYVMAYPYHGRDHRLAEGWLIAMQAGGLPVTEALQRFLDETFLVGNNQGVPGSHPRRVTRTAGAEPNGGESREA